MNLDQSLLSGIIILIFIFFISGKVRYDIVAFGALILTVLFGIIPVSGAFSGFGHPATIIVALVLVVSVGLVNCGVISHISKIMSLGGSVVQNHISLSGIVGAFLSAFMNNVATLALLMPADLQVAKRTKRSPRATLMPLSFATILGGMITMIGTPPNIIISSIREDYLGQPFKMFDFSAVGLLATFSGLIYLSLIGWKLIPKSKNDEVDLSTLDDTQYSSELTVAKNSKILGARFSDLQASGAEFGVIIRGFVRNRKFYPHYSRLEVKVSDTLLIQATPDSLDEFRVALELDFSSAERQRVVDQSDNLSICEVVVPVDSRANGKSAQSIGLYWRQGSILLGIHRRGRNITRKVRNVLIKPGDLLLLLVPNGKEADVVAWLGCWPLIDRGLTVTQANKLWVGVATFVIAVLFASLGIISLPVALSVVTLIYVYARLINPSEIYSSIEWPVIILMGSMIPIGFAFTETGLTSVVVDNALVFIGGWPHWAILMGILCLTMTLSDILNNTATALVMAPISVEIAERLGVSADPFLMAVAIAASCAFLTPIGHKNNTLIMGPGGYDFADFWRIGLPLEIIIISVSMPAILFFWPL